MRVELTGGKVSPLRAGKRGNQPSWFKFGLCFDEPSRFLSSLGLSFFLCFCNLPGFLACLFTAFSLKPSWFVGLCFL